MFFLFFFLGGLRGPKTSFRGLWPGNLGDELPASTCPQEGIMTVPYGGSLFTFSDAWHDLADPPGCRELIYELMVTIDYRHIQPQFWSAWWFYTFFFYLGWWSKLTNILGVYFPEGFKAPASDRFRILRGVFLCFRPHFHFARCHDSHAETSRIQCSRPCDGRWTGLLVCHGWCKGLEGPTGLTL